MPTNFANEAATLSEQRQQLLKIESVPLVGGVNNRYAPQDIPEGFASELMNCTLDDVTRPGMRVGSVLIGSATSGLSTTTTRPSGLGYLNCNTLANRALVMALPGDALYKTTDTTTAWTRIAFDVVSADAVLFQVANSLYIVSQDGSLEVQQLSSTGTLTAGGTSATSPPKGCVDGCYFLNRAWLFKPGTPPELHYSKLQTSTALTETTIASDWDKDQAGASSTAGRVLVAPSIGSQPRAVRPWNDTSLILFFDASIEEVVVDSADPGASGQSIRRVIEPRYGCGARDSVAAVGNEFYFLDQYGQYRSLIQTVNKEQQGVVSKPISDTIRAEIPGNINFAYLSKATAVVVQDKLKLYYCRGASTELNAYMTYDLATRNWSGPNLLYRPVGKSVVANIRNSGTEGWEEFFSDGGVSTTAPLGALSHVYRVSPTTYTDAFGVGDSSSYQFQETTRAYDFGCPDLEKRGVALELEITGDPDAVMTASVQLDENGIWVPLVGAARIIAGSGTVFPLTPADFPLTPSDFPLITVEPFITRKVWKLLDLPKYATARFFRFRFQSGYGLNIKRVAYRATAVIKNRPELG